MKKIKKIVDNVIKDVKSLFRLKREKDDTCGVKNLVRLKIENEVIKDREMEDAKNLFRLKKENEPIKDRMIKGVRNLFRLKREIDDTTIKGVKSLFRQND